MCGACITEAKPGASCVPSDRARAVCGGASAHPRRSFSSPFCLTSPPPWPLLDPATHGPWTSRPTGACEGASHASAQCVNHRYEVWLKNSTADRDSRSVVCPCCCGAARVEVWTSREGSQKCIPREQGPMDGGAMSGLHELIIALSSSSSDTTLTSL